MAIYLEVTRDKYELPIAVADTLYELADITDKEYTQISSSLCKFNKGVQKSGSYRKVEVSEKEMAKYKFEANIKRTCQQCNQIFYAKRDTAKYCSYKCRCASKKQNQKKVKIPKANNKKKTIADIEREARAAGMSYGQYISLHNV